MKHLVNWNLEKIHPPAYAFHAIMGLKQIVYMVVDIFIHSIIFLPFIADFPIHVWRNSSFPCSGHKSPSLFL